jgi:hypothetical protein
VERAEPKPPGGLRLQIPYRIADLARDLNQLSDDLIDKFIRQRYGHLIYQSVVAVGWVEAAKIICGPMGQVRREIRRRVQA